MRVEKIERKRNSMEVRKRTSAIAKTNKTANDFDYFWCFLGYENNLLENSLEL